MSTGNMFSFLIYNILFSLLQKYLHPHMLLLCFKTSVPILPKPILMHNFGLELELAPR